MSQPNTQTLSESIANPAAHVGVVETSASVVLQAAFAVMLGLFVVGFAGFSHLDAVHNAAHDTRHSNAFPCH